MVIKHYLHVTWKWQEFPWITSVAIIFSERIAQNWIKGKTSYTSRTVSSTYTATTTTTVEWREASLIFHIANIWRHNVVRFKAVVAPRRNNSKMFIFKPWHYFFYVIYIISVFSLFHHFQNFYQMNVMSPLICNVIFIKPWAIKYFDRKNLYHG